MTALPKTETLLTRVDAGVLHLTLNRPERRNALSTQMIDELLEVFGAVAGYADLRAIVLRGAGGSFCAGADVKEMPGPRGASSPDTRSAGDARAAIARGNRRFGELLSAVGNTPHPVVAVVEGAVMGGGFGLVCVSDVALAMRDARFGLPETGLGVIPAQIAPFVVQRIGLTQARRLMLTGARFDGAEAVRLGLAHELCEDGKALESALAEVLVQIRRCAPRASSATKRLLLSTLGRDLESALDEAAQVFAEASVGDEAAEGTLAFVEKRLPRWAQ
ncbi:MAG: enoyl-CoA hydratase/isomerase family protein [Polyangiales bacterium]